MNTTSAAESQSLELVAPSTFFMDIFPVNTFDLEIEDLRSMEWLESVFKGLICKFADLAFKDQFDPYFGGWCFLAPDVKCELKGLEQSGPIRDHLDGHKFITSEILASILGFWVPEEVRSKAISKFGREDAIPDGIFDVLFNPKRCFSSILNFLVECDLRYSNSAEDLLVVKVSKQHPEISVTIKGEVGNVFKTGELKIITYDEIFSSTFGRYFTDPEVLKLRQKLVQLRDDCDSPDRLRYFTHGSMQMTVDSIICEVTYGSRDLLVYRRLLKSKVFDVYCERIFALYDREIEYGQFVRPTPASMDAIVHNWLESTVLSKLDTILADEDDEKCVDHIVFRD